MNSQQLVRDLFELPLSVCQLYFLNLSFLRKISMMILDALYTRQLSYKAACISLNPSFVFLLICSEWNKKYNSRFTLKLSLSIGKNSDCRHNKNPKKESPRYFQFFLRSSNY